MGKRAAAFKKSYGEYHRSTVAKGRSGCAFAAVFLGVGAMVAGIVGLNVAATPSDIRQLGYFSSSSGVRIFSFSCHSAPLLRTLSSMLASLLTRMAG